MKGRSQHPWRLILALAAFVGVVTFASTMVGASGTNPLAGVLGVAATPFRSGFSAVATWLEERYNYAFQYEALQEENQELKAYVAQLEQALRESEDALEENERLYALLGLREKHADYELESATITARGASNWSSTLTLNRGSNYGVAVDNCVIDQYGNLVGVVIEVSYTWCTVRTVVDMDLEIGATLSRTNSTAVAQGDFSLMGEGKLKLSYLPESTQLLSGDTVLTSGVGGIYPSGLVIGTIEEIISEDSGLGRYAILTPAAELDRLTQVFVIKSFDIVE